VVLFVPGFILSFLLFPGKERLDFWERIAASVGLSALTNMLIITILAHPTIKALRFTPVIGTILLFCAACGAILAFRKESSQSFQSFFKNSKPDK